MEQIISSTVREQVIARCHPLMQFAKAIAYDGCHKIYIALDDKKVQIFRDYGYEQEPCEMVLASPSNEEGLLACLAEWYENSCSLRFIESVRHTEPDPNKGYVRVIAQFEFEED